MIQTGTDVWYGGSDDPSGIVRSYSEAGGDEKSSYVYTAVNNVTYELFNLGTTGCTYNYYINSNLTFNNTCRGTPSLEGLIAFSWYTHLSLANTYLDNILVCNDSISCNPPAPPAAPGGNIIVNITTPNNDSYYGIDNLTAMNNVFYINATQNNASDTNCTINDTARFQPTTPTGTDNLSFVNITSLTDGLYYFSIECNRSDATFNGTAFVNFTIDTIYPTITTSLSGNNTIKLNMGGANFTATINVSDINLYTLIVNDTTTGTIFSKTLINVTPYNYNLSLDVSAYPLGRNIISIIAKDGHTSKDINDYKTNKNFLTKEMTYDFSNSFITNKYIKIMPEGLGILDDFATEKKTDRYNFILKKKNINSQSFVVTSSHPIDIITKGTYKGHVVVNELNKWIDFQLIGSTGDEIYTTKRLSPYQIRVLITNLPNMDEYVFSSIGDLNVVVEFFEFFLTNATTIATANILENQTISYYLNVSTGFNITTNASFRWNDTIIVPTKINEGTYDLYNVTFSHPTISNYSSLYGYNWSFNVTKGLNTELYQINNTQTVYQILLSKCNDIATLKAINYTVRSLANDSLIQDYDFTGAYDVWLASNSGYKRNYGFTNASINSSNALCIYPPWASYTSDYTSTFSADAHDNSVVTEVDYLFSNSTISKTVYLALSASTTAITITVVDEDDFPLPGYTVTADRWVVADSNYTELSTLTTNGVGKVLFNLDLSYDYRFRVKNPAGILVHTEPRQTIIDTSLVFRIVLGTTPSAIRESIIGLDIVLTGNKTSKMFNLTWNDIGTVADLIYFNVTTSNLTNGTRSLYSSSSAAVSGVEGYEIIEDTTNQSITYYANVYIVSSVDGNIYFVDVAEIKFMYEWDVFGEESTFASFIFLAVLIFIGASVGIEAAMVLGILGLMMAVFLGFFKLGTSALAAIIVVLIIILVKAKRGLYG